MRHLKLIFAASFAIASMSAQADLIEGLCNGGADSNITCDTDTGLEWLDLTETAGLSMDDIMAGSGNFLANGWTVAHVLDVDLLFSGAGWDGVDDVATVGSAGHLTVVNTLLGLLGQTSTGVIDFGEGWALTDLVGRVSRPFYELEGFANGAGRIACTSTGFAARPGDGSVNFANCGMPSDTAFDFIGVYLYRQGTPATVPEPGTFALLGLGLAGMGLARRRKKD